MDAEDMRDMPVHDLQRRIETLEVRNEELTYQLTESMSDVQLAIDDFGWQPLGTQAEGTREIKLEKLRKLSELCRALVTVNPLVKRGVAVRTGWVWGSGVKFVVKGSTRGRPRSVNQELPKTVMRAFGTPEAQTELERSAAADGNLYFLVDQRTQKVQRVPMWQITGSITENGDTENILYYKRTWDDSVTDLDTGALSGGEVLKERWIPASTFEGSPTSRIMNIPVDRQRRIVHIAFNKMVGWRWGVPDVFAVVFWTKAYKEYLENCATLTKAYAQFAWKVTSATGKGQARVASQLAQAPVRDPATGQPRQIGASVALGAGQDLTAIQRSVSVDFNAGRPLAALIAAGLEVPLPALTSDPSEGNRATAETLDAPTVKTMEARQALMNGGLQEIFRVLKLNVDIEWPEVDPEQTHRRVQAIDVAGRSGTLFPQEWRALLLDALGSKWTERFPDNVPTEDQIPLVLRNQVAEPEPAAPEGSEEGPAQADPPSRGDHELRDEGDQAHTEDE